MLDNWCQERRKAIWVSKSAALIEDARRDWCALGGDVKDIIDLGNIKLGDPIPFTQGILFCTYSTLRSHHNGKSRLKQIVEWAGKDFEGAISLMMSATRWGTQWLKRANWAWLQHPSKALLG
ncbi:strawberry notch-like NTP hydrolase domain-containing protein [Nostoc sphaeroides]|uniref:strawberry notch-like NTP hydrolase domain-containing protein n=1 Tax=Nostoc sphaeroides TaxID=446679 RepID=UPI002B3FFDF4|nr:strawberry notch family protein [Nostoc sphaeroides]